MAKGLGSRAMLCASSMAKVSRALWPMARINWRQGIRSRPPGPSGQGPRACRLDSPAQSAGFGIGLRPQSLHPAAQVLHHGEQHIGPHMRFGVKENFFLCAALNQLLQDPAVPGVVGAGVQLPVGEGSGAALPKLDVAPGIQAAGLPEGLNQTVAGGGVLPRSGPGAGSGLRQNQSGKHTGRPKTRHNRPHLGSRAGRGMS